MSTIVDRIVKKFGTQQALAAAINADQSTVAHWKKRGVIPARQQVAILAAAKARNIELTPADFFDISEAA